MSNFAPSDPLYTVLSQFYQDRQEKELRQAKSQICAFCQTQCGQPDIRACAEANGGRTALKAAIRKINADLERGIRDDERLTRLYEVYQNVSPLICGADDSGLKEARRMLIWRNLYHLFKYQHQSVSHGCDRYSKP